MNWKALPLVLLLAGWASPAGDPAGFRVWTAAELKGLGKSMAPKMNDQKTATEQFMTVGNYLFMAAHREASGQAEYHAVQADIFVVESGQATLIYGGALVDGKTTAANEMRAESISGGMVKKLSPGDIVTIPPKMPHQIKLDPGKEFTYFVVKVTQ